eukprot:1344719-Rhodomonas_salina.3
MVVQWYIPGRNGASTKFRSTTRSPGFAVPFYPKLLGPATVVFYPKITCTGQVVFQYFYPEVTVTDLDLGLSGFLWPGIPSRTWGRERPNHVRVPGYPG